MVLALLAAAVLRVAHIPDATFWGAIGATVILVNLSLACFNLIPIPPLDGSRVLMGLLPWPAARWLARLERFGFLILLALMYVGVINRLVWPMVGHAARALGVSW